MQTAVRILVYGLIHESHMAEYTAESFEHDPPVLTIRQPATYAAWDPPPLVFVLIVFTVPFIVFTVLFTDDKVPLADDKSFIVEPGTAVGVKLPALATPAVIKT